MDKQAKRCMLLKQEIKKQLSQGINKLLQFVPWFPDDKSG